MIGPYETPQRDRVHPNEKPTALIKELALANDQLEAARRGAK